MIAYPHRVEAIYERTAICTVSITDQVLWSRSQGNASVICRAIHSAVGLAVTRRQKYPDGVKCGEKDMVEWGSTARQVESEAKDFASTLLMPFDDFRGRIAAREQPDLEATGVGGDTCDGP